MRCPPAATAAGGFIIGCAVLFPLFGGHTYLLDWVTGANGAVLPRTAYGLDGGIFTGFTPGIVASLLAQLIGQVGELAPFLFFFPLGALGVARLIEPSRRSLVPAVLLFTVNPFVFDRIYAGQIGVLLGYALLPFAVHASVRGQTAVGIRRFDAAAWWAGAALLSVHFLWIVGIVALATFIQQRVRVRTLLWLVLNVATVAVLSAYLEFAHVGQGRPVSVTGVDLAAYRTQSDPRLGLYGNVLGLYGFWRSGPKLARQSVHVWPFLLAVLLTVIIVGVVSALRDERRRPLAVVLLISGVLGFFLALGDQGPTGPAFRVLYDHLPLFDVMREPEKFSSLLALAYAVFFGWGVAALVAAVEGRITRIVVGVFLVLLPVDYTPTIFNGLAGQVKSVHVPASYAQANKLIGKGSGEVLALPWHQYESFPFTGRVIANPVPTLFDRNVISGDDVELPGVPTTSSSPRSAFLEFVYAHGSETHRFGSLIAPLGLQFVVLSKTVDWQNYAWLDHQQDLTRILDTPDLTVYRNTEPVDPGHLETSTVTLPDWGALVALSNTTDLTGTAVTVINAAPGPVVLPSPAPVTSQVVTSGSPRIARSDSPVHFTVPAGPAGLLEVSEPFNAAWRAAGKAPTELAEGQMVFPVTPAATPITFTHWPVTLAGYGISALAVVLLLIGRLVGVRRKRGH